MSWQSHLELMICLFDFRGWVGANYLLLQKALCWQTHDRMLILSDLGPSEMCQDQSQQNSRHLVLHVLQAYISQRCREWKSEKSEEERAETHQEVSDVEGDESFFIKKSFSITSARCECLAILSPKNLSFVFTKLSCASQTG